VDVLVATPGRLLDLMGDGEVDLSQVEMFVLDEADRMLDMGFIRDVRRITKALPRERQTLLFCATQPREIRELATRLLYEPVEVAVDPISSTVEPLSQSVYFVDRPRKLGLLLTLLASDDRPGAHLPRANGGPTGSRGASVARRRGRGPPRRQVAERGVRTLGA
jgi:ATP-dependent RNA helicase RhlE